MRGSDPWSQGPRHSTVETCCVMWHLSLRQGPDEQLQHGGRGTESRNCQPRVKPSPAGPKLSAAVCCLLRPESLGQRLLSFPQPWTLVRRRRLFSEKGLEGDVNTVQGGV